MRIRIVAVGKLSSVIQDGCRTQPEIPLGDRSGSLRSRCAGVPGSGLSWCSRRIDGQASMAV
eukprot:IDg21352t1